MISLVGLPLDQKLVRKLMYIRQGTMQKKEGRQGGSLKIQISQGSYMNCVH